MSPLPQDDGKKLIKSDYYCEGYAMTFDRYKLVDDEQGGIFEQFDPGCFAECDMSDVIMQYDHTGRVFARESNGTLVLQVDGHGLKIGADLSKSEGARALHEEIGAGLCRSMSFSFKYGDYYFDRGTRTIIHKTVPKIYDISAVSLPANDGTEISTRAFCDGEIAKVKQELRKREIEELKLKIKLGGF